MNHRRSIFIVLIVLVVLGLSIWLLSLRLTGPQFVSGTIEMDEVHVASRYGGRVLKIHAQEGEMLQAGQLILELNAAELQARRDYATAVLQEMEQGPRAEEISAAKAEWESLLAQLQFARVEEKRFQELFEQRTVSATERDQMISRAHAMEQSVVAAEQRYQLLKIGTRPERIAQARAQLAEIEMQLREMMVRAPDDCVLEVMNVKIGDVVSPNREVATLLLDHLWVRVYVPELWLGSIHVGELVSVHTDSSSKRFEGIIEQINRRAEFTPRNVQTMDERIRQVFGVKVRLPSNQNLLMAGMSVDIIFPNTPSKSSR